MKKRVFKALFASVLAFLLLISMVSCDQIRDVVNKSDEDVDSYELYSYAKARFTGEVATNDTFSIEVEYTVDGYSEIVYIDCSGGNFSLEVVEKKGKDTVFRCVYLDDSIYYVTEDGQVFHLAMSRAAALAFIENSPYFNKYFPALAFNLPREWFVGGVKADKNKQYQLDMELTDEMLGVLSGNVDFFANGSKLKFLFNNDRTIKKLELKKVYVNDKRCDVTVKFDWDNAAPINAPVIMAK